MGPDDHIERVLGNLLRIGVILSALVVLAGGVVYLVRHGRQPAEHHIFHGEPVELRSVEGVIDEALSLSGRGIIQLGLLLLIATPISRVGFSVFAFARQRDSLYVVLTLIVLGVLTWSLLWG